MPHGAVHVHRYRSRALDGRTRRVHVYTPPDYEKKAGAKYPVLYLIHGSGDTDGCWTELGRAHYILDNLIAQKKARPMIVVMPDAHALPPLPGAGPGRGLENIRGLPARPPGGGAAAGRGALPGEADASPRGPSSACRWAAARLWRSGCATPTSSPGSAASPRPATPRRCSPRWPIRRPGQEAALALAELRQGRRRLPAHGGSGRQVAREKGRQAHLVPHRRRPRLAGLARPPGRDRPRLFSAAGS